MKCKSYLVLGISCILFIGGCASARVAKKFEPLFYPSQPDEPRIQYLKSFSTSRDIEGEPGGFAKFIFGNTISLKLIIKPYGVTLHKGKIYVCDTVYNGLEILDLDKKSFNYFQPKGAGSLLDPINCDLSDDGTLYIADARRGQVLIFSPQGKYLTAIGTKGEFKPVDVKIYKNYIFFCDLKTHSVRVYDLSNNTFLYSIPKKGQEKEAKLFSPTNMDIDSQGNVYVSDTGSFNVKKYTLEGEYIRTFGTHGDAPGSFARPKGVAVDKEARVYVVDAAFENVQIFDSEGNLLLYFPEPKGRAGLVLPAGIFIDYNNVDYFQSETAEGFDLEYLILVVSQYGDRKVNVFGFIKKKSE